MKRFRYRLEPLLKYRDHMERMAQLETAKASSAVSECGHTIDMLNVDYHRHASELEKKMSSGVDAEHYLVYRSYLNGMEAAIDGQKKRYEQLQCALLKQQAVLKERSIAKKVLSNLKDRKKKRYYENMLKADQKETDDVIIVREARDINI